MLLRRLAPFAVLLLALAAPAASHGAAGPALTVTQGADEHPISPDIYGMNYAPAALRSELATPVNRWGGNTTDTYNWRLGSSNTGNDYFFENIADCWTAAQSYCNDGQGPNTPAYPAFVSGNKATQTKTLLTLPLLGRVAKDAKVDHPFTCGFPTGDQGDQFDPACRNGVVGGNDVASDPSRDSVPSGAADNGAWVDDLLARYGTAASGGVPLYELGNEPGLWSDTHRDMHPLPQTYDELWNSTRDTAVLVKQKDPSAKTLGFSEWGWLNYFCSDKDDTDNGCQASDVDRAAHGGTPEVNWFLQQARNYEQANGTRLLDYIDVHYYRQGGTTADVTRSLWDPTYTDPSYIDDKIRLLPRMHEWVDGDYPGTKLALTEYNLSIPDQPVLNAIIEADTLGIFAREGLDLATFFDLDKQGDKIADAFRMFRDYDGAGAKFGDTYVRSTSADESRLAVYSARRASDGATTVLVVNKTGTPLDSTISLASFQPGNAAAAYQWTGGSIAHVADVPIDAGAMSTTFPGQSLTMLVVPSVGKGPAPDPGGGGGAALTAKTLLKNAHLAKKVRASSKGRVTVGYFKCPPVCGTVRLGGPGSAKIKVKGSKKVSLVLQLSRSFRKQLAKKKTLKTTLTIAFGTLRAKQSITVLAAQKKRRKG